MPLRDTSARPRSRISSMNASILSTAPVSSKTKLPSGGIDHPGAEGVGDAHRLDPLFAGADHFHQRQFAGDMRSVHGQVGDPVHRHQPVELRLDLLDHHAGAGGDDVDAAARAGGIDRGDGQAVDIVAAAGEQPDDPREDAGLRCRPGPKWWRCAASCQWSWASSNRYEGNPTSRHARGVMPRRDRRRKSSAIRPAPYPRR